MKLMVSFRNISFQMRACEMRFTAYGYENGCLKCELYEI